MAESGKAQMGRISREMDDFVSGVCIDLAVDINRQLEANTPKDTGLASKNWIASKKAGKGKLVSPPAAATAAQLQGIQAIKTFDSKRDERIIVENNTPYISDLNDGSSRKAPAGFVQSSIARALRALRRSGGKRRRTL